MSILAIVGGVALAAAALGVIIFTWKTDKKLRRQAQELSDWFEFAPDPMLIVTREGQILKVNEAFVRLFGYSKKRITALHAKDLYFNPEERITLTQELHKAGSLRDREVCWKTTGEEKVFVILSSRSVEYDDGQVVFQTTVRDVTEHKKMEEELKHYAGHDNLTELPNRRSFMTQLYYAVKVAQRNQDPIAVLFMDLDNFKKLNDTKGHEAVDKALIFVAKEIAAVLRSVDILARLGGDEFVILLASGEINRRTVSNVTEKIFIAMQAVNDKLNYEVKLGISIGVRLVTVPTDSNAVSAESIIREADKAMYIVKTNGKGQVHFFS